jgi:hypothetical protein
LAVSEDTMAIGHARWRGMAHVFVRPWVSVDRRLGGFELTCGDVVVQRVVPEGPGRVVPFETAREVLAMAVLSVEFLLGGGR